jgi:hypothetical protein
MATQNAASIAGIPSLLGINELGAQRYKKYL